ncbi:hypothetical protein Tco_1110618 [Tanacetum coccineum]|uniref:Coilin n=1 Tax=Tanacetum coccineum TaxID=301880 RepID=A0ABQ5IKU1_9ASTR
MDPESSQAMVLLKFDMHIYTFILTAKELKEVITEYCVMSYKAHSYDILDESRFLDSTPSLPPPDLTMNKLPSSLSAPGAFILYKGSGLLTMDDFLKLPMWSRTVSKGDSIPDIQHPPLRTTLPLEVGKLIPKKSPAQRSIEKPNRKIATAKEKKDRQNLAKAKAKRAGEGVSVAPRKKRVRRNQEPTGSGSEGAISATPLHQASPKPVDETATSIPKDSVKNVEKEENVVFSDAHSFHSAYYEDDQEDVVIHRRAYQSLGQCVLSQDRLRTALQREMQANNGLSKKFALLDSAHSSCSGKEMELLDRPKDMEKERHN